LNANHVHSIPEQIEPFSDEENLPYKRNISIIPEGRNVLVKESISDNESLSSIILRPDFEEQHENLFRNAFSQYHRLQFLTANNIVNECLQNAHKDHLYSGLSSFKLLHHLIHLKTPYKWSGPIFKKHSNDGNIEDIIVQLIESVREWIFYKSGDVNDKYRKKEMDDDIPYAFDAIHEWVPIPPVEGARVTDVKVSISFSIFISII
jgi:hypothetical protein